MFILLTLLLFILLLLFSLEFISRAAATVAAREEMVEAERTFSEEEEGFSMKEILSCLSWSMIVTKTKSFCISESTAGLRQSGQRGVLRSHDFTHSL